MSDAGGGCASQDVVDIADGAWELGVEISDHGEVGVIKDVGLNVDLGTHAGVDTGGLGTKIVGVEDVGSSESDGWETRVDLRELVVVVGDVKLSSILRGVVVRVTNERALPVSLELVP